MKKQTISKIAAVALAAMTVVPMFGTTVSAAVVHEGTAATGGVKTITGTASKVAWRTKRTVKTLTLQENADGTLLITEATTLTTWDTKGDKQAFSEDAGAPKFTVADTIYCLDRSIYTDAYKDLTEAVKQNNAAEKQRETDLRTAVKNYNHDKLEWAKAVARARNKTVSSGETTTKDSFTDSTGSRITVTYTPGTGNVVSAYASGAAWDFPAKPDTDSFTTYEVITDHNDNLSMEQLANELGDMVTVEGGIIKHSEDPDADDDVRIKITDNDGTAPSGGGTTTTNPVTGVGYQTTPNAIYRYYTLNSPYYYSSYYTASAAGGNTAVYDWVTGQKVYDPATVYPSYATSVSSTYRYIVAEIPYQYFKSTDDAKEAARQKNITSPTIKDVYNDASYNPYGYLYGYGYGAATTTTTKDTSTVTIGNYKGWTYVTRYINSAKSGASYTVKMNTETEIPTTVLKALYGKNVTVNFKFSSGATLSIKGTDMASTSTISTNIRYVKNVPSALVKKAVKANSGVSSAQFAVSGGSIGANASVTVKFDTKRSGCTATLYRYDTSANSLKKVSSSTVKSNGYCTLSSVDRGGDYVIVLS